MDRRRSNPYGYVPAPPPQTPYPSPPYQYVPMTNYPTGFVPSGQIYGPAHGYPTPGFFQHPPLEPTGPDVHPLLAGTPFSPRSYDLNWDVRFNPERSANINSTPSHRPIALPKDERSASAISPAVHKMRLVSKHLPWSIVVANKKGITVMDVLLAIYTTLQISITEGEYWMGSDDDRKRMKRAWNESWSEAIGKALRQKEDGVRRVDFLAERTQFSCIRQPADDDESDWAKERAFSDEESQVWILDLEDRRQ